MMFDDQGTYVFILTCRHSGIEHHGLRREQFLLFFVFEFLGGDGHTEFQRAHHLALVVNFKVNDSGFGLDVGVDDGSEQESGKCNGADEAKHDGCLCYLCIWSAKLC